MAAIPCRVAWVFRAVSVVAAGLLLLGTTHRFMPEQTLQSIRNDVRDGPPPLRRHLHRRTVVRLASLPANSDDSSLDDDTKLTCSSLVLWWPA